MIFIKLLIYLVSPPCVV